MNEFAILDIARHHFSNVILMTLPTNNPCHLTCYVTSVQPLKHHTTRIVRGLSVPWGVYFCMVSWHAFEQEEAGDTLTHTFVIPEWYQYQRKWFTFRGTVGGVISPSVGPIIEHRHPGQDIILNPTYVEWPFPDPLPTHWLSATGGPGPWTLSKDTSIYTRDGISPRLWAKNDFSAISISQRSYPEFLANRKVEISCQVRGFPAWGNYLTVAFRGTPFRFYQVQVTKLYDWEWLSVTHTCQPDLTWIEVVFTIFVPAAEAEVYGWVDNWHIFLR